MVHDAAVIDAFLGPMFESRVSLFGLSWSVVNLLMSVVAVVGSTLFTLYIVRRYSSSEGTYRSFRATTHPDATDRLVRGVALAVVAFVAVFALATFAAG